MGSTNSGESGLSHLDHSGRQYIANKLDVFVEVKLYIRKKTVGNNRCHGSRTKHYSWFGRLVSFTTCDSSEMKRLSRYHLRVRGSRVDVLYDVVNLMATYTGNDGCIHYL